MGRGQVALVAALGVAVVLIWAAVWRTVAPVMTDASPSPTTDAGASPPPSASPSPSSAVTPVPTPTTTPVPTQVPTEPPQPTPVAHPPDDVDPRVAWTAFAAHLDGLRPEAAALTDALVSAADDGDRAAVRSSAVGILQLADRERDWLAANPPARCYADAHTAAGAMVDAYADVAERAIAWSESEEGLDALGALAELIAGAGAARDALTDLAAALEATTCPG